MMLHIRRAVFLLVIAPAADADAQRAPSGDADTVQAAPAAGARASSPVVFEMQGGSVRPTGSMRAWSGTDGAPLFDEAAWGGVGFGFRVARHAQIDLGFEMSSAVIGAGRDVSEPPASSSNEALPQTVEHVVK